jgi:hypothetical protein
MKGPIMNRVRLYCIALALGSIAMAGRMQSLATEVVLYNGAAGGLPASQGHFTYADPGGQATQSFSNGVTTFDTTASNSISAGYGYTGATDGLTFDRAAGYTVRVTVQIMSEQHANPDRAGFSMIALSSDHRGIELGFWADQIWAQNYDATAAACATTAASVPIIQPRTAPTAFRTFYSWATTHLPRRQRSDFHSHRSCPARPTCRPQRRNRSTCICPP